MNLQPAEVIALLCQQKHDFLNELQVISGYIQLNNSERVLTYLKQTVKRLEHSGRLLRIKSPELALIAVSKVGTAAAKKGIVVKIEVHTMMENLLQEVNELIPLWTVAWDAALALTCSGALLKVSLSCQEKYYHLHFATEPLPQAPPEIASIDELARRCGAIFDYQAQKGEISLYFASGGNS